MKDDVRDFAIRELGCTACFLFGVAGRVPCEKHHLNEGDQPGRKRRGEKQTVGLCQWHHVGICAHNGSQTNCASCIEERGPSWRHSKRAFIDRFGTGDDLLAAQNERLAGWKKTG